MNLCRTWSVRRKETRHILRDRSTSVLVITSSVLLLVMAYALSIDIQHVTMALTDQV